MYEKVGTIKCNKPSMNECGFLVIYADVYIYDQEDDIITKLLSTVLIPKTQETIYNVPLIIDIPTGKIQYNHTVPLLNEKEVVKKVIDLVTDGEKDE